MTATERATDALRQMIFDGTLSPNSDHLERDLTERLSMSRTPVREALGRLEGQGLVQVRPRHGVRILGLSPADMNEIYQVLTELESAAAAHAAERQLQAKDLSEMQVAIDAMDAALEARNLEDWARADEAFHAALVQAAGNRRLVAATRLYSDQVRRARAMTLHLRPFPQSSNEDHRSILKAITDGDSQTARRLHHAHRTQAHHMLITLLSEHDFKAV